MYVLINPRYLQFILFERLDERGMAEQWIRESNQAVS
jgi:hypothetical protein